MKWLQDDNRSNIRMSRVLAHDPPTLRRIWSSIKELLYVAVSASKGCHYCIASHGAAARRKGVTEA